MVRYNISKAGVIIMKKIVDKTKYLPRIIDKTILQYLSIFGAVVVEGPKWCGKTWTSSYHSNSEYLVGDPTDGFQNRELANISPSLVLQGDTPRLIDEWQEVPSLWDAVRYEVDKRGEKGQFILTGSSTPKTKGILHSGAGRIAKLKMRTMSLFESGDSSGDVSLLDLCNGKINPKLTGEVNLEDLAGYIVRGGWPGNLKVKPEHATLLPGAYLESILEDDFKDIDGIKYDTSKMKLLLKSLARNESTVATNKKLLDDIKHFDDDSLNLNTIATYLNVFERLFLLDNQPAFSTNIRSQIRVKQAPKRQFCDPSLPSALLKLTSNKLIGDLKTFGFLFESLCQRDLKIYAQSFNANVYHYMDYSNNEIDAVIELEDGRWCAFEIKLGANQIDDAAEKLIKIRDAIVNSGGIAPSVLCVISGLSNAAYQRPDGVFVVPITALKD
jgi:predicted AAA+ superfamily ATPase